MIRFSMISTLDLNIPSLVSLSHFPSRLSPVLVTNHFRGKLHCNYVLINWKNCVLENEECWWDHLLSLLHKNPFCKQNKNEYAQGVSRFLDKLNKFASYSFILAVSLYPFAGEGIQSVKATDQSTLHLSGVLFLLQEQLLTQVIGSYSFFFNKNLKISSNQWNTDTGCT